MGGTTSKSIKETLGFRTEFCDNLIINAFGDNEYGNVSNFNTQQFKNIFVGNFQCFGIDIYDKIFCWGLNDYGQLGFQKINDYIFKNEEEEYNPNIQGSVPFINTFFELTYPKYLENNLNIFHTIKIKQISCGDGFTIVLDNENNLFSFGRNDEGQLGFSLDYNQYKIVNDKKVVLIPHKIEFFNNNNNNIKIKEVICGSNFTFILDENKIAYSFGDNSNGQLARDTKGHKNNPHPEIAEFISYLGEIKKICCGWSHGMMLDSQGEIYVWGNYFKDYKNIIDFAEDIIIPKKIKIENDSTNQNDNEENNSYDYLDISSGFNHLAIIAKKKNNKNKELFTWGANEFGQTGLNTQEILIKAPKRVIFSESSIDKIYCGAFHSIALLENNKLYGFGDNSYRQIGNYTTETIIYPIISGFDLESDKYELDNIYCANGFTVIARKDKKMMQMKITSQDQNPNIITNNEKDFEKIGNVEMNRVETKGNEKEYEDHVLETNKQFIKEDKNNTENGV